MNNNRLHIVAFDVPYPPNYGGIADVFYKLKSLHDAGLEIIYHCFYYKGHNPPTAELKKYCSELYYYERNQNLFKLFFSRLPFIVSTRDDHTLLVRLLADPAAPILMDGIQCTYWILHPDIQDQKIIYRANNIEHEYYEGLAHAERNMLRKWYLNREAKKLRNYEWQIRHAEVILSVAKQDISHFEQYAKTIHLPPFFDDTHSLDLSIEPMEKYVLFQGNLSVKENEKAATHIIQNIAPLTTHKIIIAGKSPAPVLHRLAKMYKNVSLIDTPEPEEMTRLINDAQVHLLMTFQQTGIKLKLLHALQSGRHIIINKYMDDDGLFSALCEVVDGDKEIAEKIDSLMQLPFTNEMKEKRDLQFNALFSNKMKAEKIVQWVKKLQREE